MYQHNGVVFESHERERITKFNPAYLKSSFCIIKFLLILTLFGGCFSASYRYSYWFESKYYNFVAVTGILYQVLAIIFNLFKVPTRFSQVPWNSLELVHDILWGILILIASAVASDYVRRFAIMETYAAAAGFGYFALLLYIIDGILRIISIIKSKSLSSQSNNHGSSSSSKYQHQSIKNTM